MKQTRETPLRRILARNIRERRAKLQMSQEELADEAEIHRTNISKIERELHAVSIDNLYWIARALKVSPQDLLTK